MEELYAGGAVGYLIDDSDHSAGHILFTWD